MVEPNIQSIVITNAIGLALLAILLISSYMTRERHHLDDRIFTLLIFVCAGGCFFEPVTWLVDGVAEPWAVFLNYFGNTYCYLCSCTCPYLWVLYVDIRLHKGRNRIKNWFPIALVPVVVVSVMIIANLFGHFMFTVDENNVYSRLPLSYLIYVLMFGQFFYSVWLKRKYQRKHGRVRFFPMAMFLVPIIVGAGVQAAFFGISIAWPSVCIGLAGIHMSLQNELSYIDPLTNLYNRTYMDGLLKSYERTGKRFGGIMIDLDYFKDINDTLGHSTGDDALAQAANLLVASSPESATILRFAGDEFVVLLADAEEDQMTQLEHAIEEAIRQFNAESGKPYQLQISMGSSLFKPGEDSIDEFQRRIDERMYAQKRAHHEQ